jgi:proteasome assembly chaperone (PAC2) family protein
MGVWKIERISEKPRLRSPILIEGLPGIGNVGKVVVDFIVEKTGARLLFRFNSYSMPHSVFINEHNLVQLPTIEMYYKQYKNRRNDLLLLVGDIQPIDEVSCYEFSDQVLDILRDFKAKELITIGGIGLNYVPRKPKVYCTANNKGIVSKYKSGTALHDKLYGVVGPIVGVSGLLVGLATKKHLSGISMLAETYGHPLHVGVKGAREILKVLNTKLDLRLNLNQLDREIARVEVETIKRTESLGKLGRQTNVKRLGKLKDISYIG